VDLPSRISGERRCDLVWASTWNGPGPHLAQARFDQLKKLVIVDFNPRDVAGSSCVWVNGWQTPHDRPFPNQRQEGDVDSTGTYADKLRRADGRWLITEHRLTIDPSWKGEPPPRPH
jgi:hypothetical protein